MKMSQVKQTCSVTNGSQAVVLAGIDLTLRIKRNSIFMVDSLLVPYTVAADATFDGTNTHVTLTGNYVGDTNSSAPGVFVADYTYPDMLPTIAQGDVGTAAIWTATMYKLQEMMTAASPSGFAVVAAQYNTVVADTAVVVSTAAGVATNATAAADSAITATTQATAAASSASALAAQLASFREKYLGSFATDPALDGNGAALTAGTEYFNTTEHKLRVYSGTAWGDYDADAQIETVNAALSAAAAAGSASGAATSATASATSATASSDSAATATTQAGISTAQAGISTAQAGNSAASATASAASAITAGDHVTESAASATAASISATSAADSAVTATTQATAATTNGAAQVTLATAQATDAAASAASAASSVATAASSATAASASATGSASSAAAAAGSAAAAATSVTTATTKAADASASALAASTSAASAATSATSASDSATAATTQAAAAVSSATTATTQAGVSTTQAEAAAASAAASAASAAQAASGQINADWNATTGVAQILNKPTITAAAIGLGNVENKTSATIRSELTALNVTTALTFTPLDAAQKGAASGVAPLGSDSKIAAAYLPSYVDDVLEFANLASMPAIGEAGKIYVALDTNKAYRWSGSAYIYITSGAVDSVAGKGGVVVLVKGDVGLDNVDNTSDLNKPVSTATQAAITAITANSVTASSLLASEQSAALYRFLDMGDIKDILIMTRGY